MVKKSLVCIIIVLFYAMGLLVPAYANSGISDSTKGKISNSVVLLVKSPKALSSNLNETFIDVNNLDVTPLIVDGRTLVPVRFISEKFGVQVDWNQTTRVVTLKYGKITASIKIGENKLLIDNSISLLDVPAKIINGRTYLPLRKLVEEVLKKKIFYSNHLIIINDENLEIPKSDIDILIEKLKPTDVSEENKTITFYLNEFESYDPAYTYEIAQANITQSIFEGLVRYKKNSTEVEPALATNWEISSDMKTYKFMLRKGVKFHDGSDFNADSVLYSFQRQLIDNQNDNMIYASFIFDIVSKVEKIDDFTVKITLNQPSVTFLTSLAMYHGAPIISPEACKKDEIAFGQNPVGTGPYKMIKHEKGKTIELIRNSEYWGEKAKIEKVLILLNLKKTPEMVNELLNGQIDLFKVNKKNEINMSTAKFDIQDTYYISYNCAKPPFNNRNFREGVSHLINRDELINTNPNIIGEKAETLIPPNVLGYNSNVKAYDFDISKAKDLLNDFPKDKELSIIYYFKGFETIGKAIVDNLSKAGIKAKHFLLDEDFEEIIKSGNMDIVIEGWQSDNGDPDNFMCILDSSYIEDGLNSSKFSNEELDLMLHNGRMTLRNRSRAEIYKKAEELISKEVPILPLFHGGSIYAYSSKLKKLYIAPTGVMILQNFE